MQPQLTGLNTVNETGLANVLQPLLVSQLPQRFGYLTRTKLCLSLHWVLGETPAIFMLGINDVQLGAQQTPEHLVCWLNTQ